MGHHRRRSARIVTAAEQVRRARDRQARRFRILRALNELETERKGLPCFRVYANEIAVRAGLSPRGAGAILSALCLDGIIGRSNDPVLRCYAYYLRAEGHQILLRGRP